MAIGKAKPVSPDFFNFDESAIHLISQEFGLSELDEFYPILLDGDTCALLEVRSETSRKMIVGSSHTGNKFFLKQIPWYCDDDEKVKFSHDLQLYLADEGQPVAKIQKTKSGGTYLPINNTKFVLFKCMDGYRYAGNSKQIESAALALANLHDSKFESTEYGSIDFFSVPSNLIDLLRKTDNQGVFASESDFLSKLLTEAKLKAKDEGWDQLPKGVIHGDYCPWNMLFQKDEKIQAILDFDNCEIGSRLHDIAEAIVTFSFMNYRKDSTNFIPISKDGCDTKIAKKFLDAYSSVSELSVKEKQLLSYAVKTTLIEFFALGLIRKDFGKESWENILRAMDKVPEQISDLINNKEKKSMSAKFLAGVSVVLENAGRVLLLHRASSKDHGAGDWEPVSGRIEAGETPEQAAIREVKEETGMEVSKVTLYDSFSFTRKPTNEQLLGFTFFAEAFSDAVQMSDEHDEYKWIGKNQLDEQPISPAVRASLEKFWAHRYE